MSREKSFSIIGAGVMGRGMAMNLNQAGARVHVYSRNPDGLSDLASAGIHCSSDPVETSRTTAVVVLCLTTDEVLNSIVFEGGLYQDLVNRVQDGERITLIDTGTTSPDFTARLYEACQNQGIQFIDAPMTGSKNAARAGEILFMAGGSKESLEAQKFFFDTCGKMMIHCGPVGHGQKVKIALNLTQASMMQALTEGWILSQKLGVDSEVYDAVIRNSAARSGLSDFKLPFVYSGNYEEHFALKNMNKDVNHAMRLALEYNVALPVASAIKGVYEAGMNRGFGEEDFCGLARINEMLNGLDK